MTTSDGASGPPPPPSSPAGWHPDPHAVGTMRYWDGTGWTDHTAPAAATPSAVAMAPSSPPKKKRRIFWWFFLAVQILFLIWVIAGAHTASGNPTDCGTLDAQTCNDASDAGTAIGVAVVVVFWVIVDFLLTMTYGIYRLTRRSD